jgi:hypothetical protein
MSVTNPEEYRAFISQGAASVELKKPLVIPESNPDAVSLYRYCSDDGACGHSDDAGCRRTEIMIKWESENAGTLLPAGLAWGARDHFFFYEGKIYYYKPFLEKILAEDIKNNEEDRKDPAFATYLNSIQPYAEEFGIDATTSLDDIRTLISSNPAGMLPFVAETDNFFVFETPGDQLVTEITRDVLNAVQSSFTDEYRFAFFDPADTLYIKDGKAYWTDLMRWVRVTSDVLKQGISLNGKFYPFGTLTDEARRIVTLAGQYYAKDYLEPFEIIELP